MLCHKCPHHESIQRGDYSSKPWKDTPCAKCKLGEDTFYSVPFDEEQPIAVAGIGDPGSAISSYTSGASTLKPQTPNRLLPEDTIATIIQGLLTLDPILRDIVAWRYQGIPYKEIGRRQGTSTQLAEMRHKRALRDWPALKALFPEKIAKQARRKGGA